MAVVVNATKILEQSLSASGQSLVELIDLFTQWKSLGPQGEDDFYEFGKDVPYETPHVNGKKNVLRHVHLTPVIEFEKLTKWNSAWEHRSRRVSNKAMVYVDDGPNRFLLIAVLPEPYAHDICKMKTPEHKILMNEFADIADAFIYSNQIIA